VTATDNNSGRAKAIVKSGVTETITYNALGQMIKTSGGAAGTVLYWYDEGGICSANTRAPATSSKKPYGWATYRWQRCVRADLRWRFTKTVFKDALP
jgi:hypothetical protein